MTDKKRCKLCLKLKDTDAYDNVWFFRKMCKPCVKKFKLNLTPRQLYDSAYYQKNKAKWKQYNAKK